MGNSATSTSQIQHAAAADPLASPILKLDVDCFEELFEWLSLADLRALRQTCKRLKQVVDYFIKNNYPAVKIGFGCIGIIGVCNNWIFEGRNCNEVKFKELDPIKVKMIKEVEFRLGQMTVEKIDAIKRILSQLERLSLEVVLKANFYESILKWCSNLKYLAVDELIFNEKNPEDNDWLKHQLAPTIEHLKIEFYCHKPRVNIDFVTFFQLNPNIQTFSISATVLEAFANCFFGSNIKIDRLNVKIHYSGDVFENCRILNILYKQEFYKRLHLAVEYVKYQEDIYRIALTCGMEKLNFYNSSSDVVITLPPTPCLREICFIEDPQLGNVDINSMARNLINLERVYFAECQIEFIIPFIRYAPKMKEIKVDVLKEGAHFENGVIDLSALNKERKGLTGASKVTIYVKEDTFLSTKFATTKTEINFITLKRAEAVEWTGDEWSFKKMELSKI